MAVKFALIAFGAGFGASAIVALIVIGRLSVLAVNIEGEEAVSSTYPFALIMALVLGGGAVAGTVFALASGVGNRATDLSLAVSKMGRGTKASVRVSGNDELTTLGRTLSSLSSEMAGQQADDGGGAAVDVDPHVRELRDKVLSDQHPEAPPGYEVDAGLAAGSRGGLDYFDCVTKDGTTVMFLISAGGNNTASVVASRMARDEIVRAVGAGANGRKALSHTNRVLHKNLPRGVCAVATLLEVGEGAEIKVYQAGSRVPVVLCAAGELEDLTAEGLALGLDSGPVFEKGLRSAKLDMAAGMRLVVLNDAGNRNEELIESVREHSPKHTAPFMNMVLGELEDGAGPSGLREDVVLMTLKRG